MAPASTPTGRRSNPLARLFSSITFGVILLSLIFVYSAVVSAVAPVRYAVEMTEMRVFQHWIFATLVALFCITLSVTTWRRIGWNVTNLGVLTVHAGLLLLIGGSTLYFAGKIEGDVLLHAPALELFRTDDPAEPVVQIPAEPGQSWENESPQLRVEVVAVRGDASRAVRAATARITTSSGTRDVALDDSTPSAPLLGVLGMRLRPSTSATQFCDHDSPALYWRKTAEPIESARSAPLAGLPMYLERFLPSATVIRDSVGRVVESHRTKPELRFGGMAIPTGWIEDWRMPVLVRTDDRELPFDVAVTAYLPVVREFAPVVRRDDGATANEPPNPGLSVSFQGVDVPEMALFAADPRRSLVASSPPIEFLWAQDAVQREEFARQLAGPHELTISVRNPPQQLVVAVQAGQTIQIDGTPYELTVRNFEPSWPLVSAGYQGAQSPVATVDINSGIRRFSRTVIARFPQLSQDIDEQGVRLGEGLIDDNIQVTYRTTAAGLLRFVAGPGDGPAAQPELVVFLPNGRPQRTPLNVGAATPLALGPQPVSVAVASVWRNAIGEMVPIVEAPERRNTASERQHSAIRLELTGRGKDANWKRVTWCRFSSYPDDLQSRVPLEIDGPDGQIWELVYSRSRHDLSGELSLHKLSVRYKPGRRSVDWWRSDYRKRTEDEPMADSSVETNTTDDLGQWTLFQASAPGGEPYFRFTVLGVGNRRGVWTMTIGCALIVLGSLYAFYVKPVIRRRRAAQALADARRRGVLPGADDAAKRGELLEIGR